MLPIPGGRSQALAASVFVAFSVWPLWLTGQSSRPAFGGRLTLFVSPITRFMRAPTCSSAPPCSQGFQAFLASSACAASATSYPFSSSASPRWRTVFSWFAPIVNLGFPVLASGSNRAVKPTRLRRAAYFRSLGLIQRTIHAIQESCAMER